jgi:hypothetical protein
VSKKQKLLTIVKSESFFFIISALIVAGLFVILTPKVSSLLFSFKRESVLNDFINKTKMEGMISPRDYWQFREFYSPGVFTFSKTAQKEIAVNFDKKLIDSTFLSFLSPNLSSSDMLTKQTDLNKIFNQSEVPLRNILFKSTNGLIYKTGNNTIKIVFLLGHKEIQKISGISDYLSDKQIDQENWFNVTSLKIK